MVFLALLGVVTHGGAASAQAPAEERSSERSGELLALTYNVAGLPEMISGSDPATNMPLISPLLNDYDLVLVQEDFEDPVEPFPLFFYHHDLVSAVNHPFLSDPARPPLWTDLRRPEAIVADGLNRLSRFEFGPLTREMWTNCFGGPNTADGGAGDCLSQKGFSMARTTLAPGVEVDVYNLHAEAGGTELDERYRADDYVQLAAFMANHSEGRAVIVGGDMNLHTDEEPDATVWTRFLEESGLADVCEVVDCGADAHVIDKFAFRSGGGVDLTALSHRFERDKFQRDDGEPLSDHDALAVAFRWTVAAPADLAAPAGTGNTTSSPTASGPGAASRSGSPGGASATGSALPRTGGDGPPWWTLMLVAGPLAARAAASAAATSGKASKAPSG